MNFADFFQHRPSMQNIWYGMMDKAEEFFDFVGARLVYIQKQLLRNLMSAMVFTAAIIFGLIAVYFLQIEFFNFSKTLSFAIIAAIAIIIGIILRRH